MMEQRNNRGRDRRGHHSDRFSGRGGRRGGRDAGRGGGGRGYPGQPDPSMMNFHINMLQEMTQYQTKEVITKTADGRQITTLETVPVGLNPQAAYNRFFSQQMQQQQMAAARGMMPGMQAGMPGMIPGQVP